MGAASITAKIRLHAWILTFMLALGVLSVDAAADADEERSAAARLRAVQSEIRDLRERLAQTEGRAGELQARLAETEREAGRIAKALHETQAKLAERQARLAELEGKRERQQAELGHQRAALSRQMRAAHAAGREGKLKLLLNQQSPAAVGRMLVYYDYFNRARVARINGVNDTLAALDALESQLDRETRALTRLNEDLQQEKSRLEAARADRHQVLAALKQEIGAADQALSMLLEDEKRLEELIASIRQALADIPPGAGAGAPFAELKGRLPWPATGSISGHFGAARFDYSGREWQGVLIDSAPGEAVRAVSGGRVAFADWMRGFGLLMIIDHGEGYMSLYGHNQSLYKSTGEWVQAGELIARVGDSGGLDSSGLYFEIRLNGEPLDPASWFADRQKSARAG